MKASTTVLTQKRRGPKPTGKGTLVGVRLQPDLLDALDRFIAEENPDMSRPEALRFAFRDWLIGHDYLPHKAEEGMKPDELTSENDG